ncbi:TetR/AcrR family transcriptional regulator [Paenibacillus hexagrammi]|uniref:TetR/AcrR family transcriptional regulator n=1 Tax=Paenibacillus hexagrammi TaxID=2908839 RepID=A0ABY3SK34_9BACL|nr:TetR/AcrR family transcriptional regulator [Paenibacillus sp. YPD9-1]UJF33505.1 TetR/AcrR family transcriptional regulator [Paenibacillus sp. YPD9-1]
MPRTLDENKEALIIQSAKQLFGRFGYKKTTIEDIAQAAGIAKGTVYIYFSNKKRLLVRIGMQTLLESHEQLQRELAHSDDVAWKIRQIIRGRVLAMHHFTEQFPDAVEMIPHLEQGELLQDGGEQLFGIEISMLQQALTQGVEKGIFEVPNIPALIDHICFMTHAFEPPYKRVSSFEELLRHVDLYTDTLLASISKGSEKSC